ncbi:non-ribosomal peptide synthetase, partial [Dickeya sp. NCPPB 3274]|uniref:non-ribosomal peptide synthetase n=1 Tax=Dickeya sp. NCPPB 3274 TaxID=568766 RepID=UPI00187C982D
MSNNKKRRPSNYSHSFPLSTAQQGIWLAQEVNQDAQPNVFKVSKYTDIGGQVDANILKVAIAQAIEETESFRSVIDASGSTPVQRVSEAPRWAFPTLDFSTEQHPEQCARQWMQENLNQHFDIEQGPLFSFALLRIAPERFFFYQCAHHMVIDGYSGTLMTRRIADIYSTLMQRQPVSEHTFGGIQELMNLEQDYHTSSHFERDRQYWLALMQNAPTPVSLANQQARCSDIVRRARAMNRQESQRIRDLARQHDASLAQLFTALTAIYLYRMTGQNDLVMGLPVTARMTRQHRSLAGMSSNIVPMRLALSADLTLSQCLQQVKGQLSSALRHQRYRGEQLRTDLGLATENRTFYATAFNFLPLSGEVTFDGLNTAEHNLAFGPVDDLSVTVSDLGEHGLEFYMDANAALYSTADLDSHLHRLLCFIAEADQHQEKPVGERELFVPGERARILEHWNAAQLTGPVSDYIHLPFEALARQQPETTALSFNGKTLSYGELNRRANQLAWWLRQQGVGPDSRVGIALERSHELVIALLATLKAGGAYVPLDPDYPEERLSYMIDDSQPAVLITSQSIHARVSLLSTQPSAIHLIELDGETTPWQQCPTDNINPSDIGLERHHLAYVIYTSGSTGQPKGVMNEHRGVVNRLAWMIEDYAFNAQDIILQKTPFSFDVSVWEFFCPLWVGATLLLAKPEGHKDPYYLSTLIEQARVTIAHFVPPMLSHFLSVLKPGQCPSLRAIFCSGEALPAATIRQTGRYLPHTELHNLYGPTEAAVDVTGWACAYDADNVLVSIGRPKANVRLYILDPQGHPVPVGVVGELHIGGVQVARGYLNRPELSAERFIPDPFLSTPGACLYKTGDLGRWRADGTIDYLGRNDFQVKIRGFRIELGEIESCARNCAGVTDVIVMARPDQHHQPRLIAWFTGHAEVAGLHTHLAAQLPVHMLPGAYIHVDTLPLTPNGKVDRKALPDPTERDVVRTEYEAPQGELEQLLAALWQDLLGIEHVGRQDHFFALGGHSLLVITLLERLRRAGYTLSVSELFKQPTLAALAAALTKTITTDAVPATLIPPHAEKITPAMLPLVALTQAQIDTVVATVPGGARNVQDIYPLAPLQTGILFHHLLQPVGDAYITRSILSFEAQAGLDNFVSALQAVIQRHDILRTAVVWEGLDDAVQVVWREARMPVETLEISADDVTGALHQQFDPTRLSMNIAQAPMIQGYQVADPVNNRWLLCLLHHHLCMDHTTLELLLEEVQAHLEGKADQLPTPLPFRQFVALARQQTAIPAQQSAQQDYFRTQLGDIDAPCAPFGLLDIQGDGQNIGRIEECHLPLESELAQRLRVQSQQRGVTVASLFHLAWGRVVQATTGQDDVVFGTVLFGRMAGGEGADRVLGMFLNTLPLRLSLGQVSVQQALRQTQDSLADLLNVEHASLAEIQQCSGVDAQSPLFTSLLNYRYDGGSQQLGAAERSGITGMNILFSQERTHYPVNISVNDHRGVGFSLDVQVDQRIGAERAGQMMLAALAELANALEQTPERPVPALNILPDAERQQVLHDFNDTAADFPADQCIHERFEQQAARSPDTIAVVFEGQSLSYRELNEQANQLAHWLIELGVRPDQRVAIALERRPELIVALLATLKAGGAYVPIDPGYASQRLSDMLADSAPVALITTRTVRTTLITQTTADLAVIELDSDVQPWATCPTDNIAPATLGLTPRHLAYIIYTSGSTGRPKGAMIEHRSLMNYLYWSLQTYPNTAGDRIPMNSSIGFDATITSVFVPILVGKTLYIVDSQDEIASLYHALVSGEPFSFIKLTPSYLDALSRLLISDPNGVDIATLPGLQQFILGGEAVLERHVSFWRQHRPDVRIVNEYGPTETVVGCCMHTLSDLRSTGAVPIGRPIANTRMYILDEHRQPVPVGVVGEIYIGGMGVARGYLNRPDLTAERFLDDPFATETDARMYRAGDLARWNADGTLDYLGRNDFQVKIRGFRIEPGEVESALQSCDGVSDAVVIAQRTDTGDHRLVAYYTLSDASVSIETLKQQLARLLPDFMVPSAYVPLAQIPLTRHGKVDRNALPAPDDSAFVRTHYEAPRNATEQAIATLWQDLLGIEQIGRQDHFFELGGHSLLAIKLIERLRRAGYSLSVSELFRQPTLAALATTLTASTTADTVPANRIPLHCEQITPEMLPLVTLTQAQIDAVVVTVPGGVRNVQDIYPLAPLQSGILFHHLLQPVGDAYITRSILSFKEQTGLDNFIAALQAVIQRHDILRTAIVWEGLNEAVQVVWREALMPVETLRFADEDVIKALQQRFNPAQLQMNIAQAPMIQAWQAEDPANDRWLLCLLHHHLCMDHTTLELLLEEVQAHLQDRADQLPAPLPFRQFVALARQQAAIPAQQSAQQAYFRAQLGDIDEPCAPFGLLDIQGNGQHSDEHHLPLSDTLAQRLRAQSQQRGVTVASLFHLAWGRVVQAATGQDDVVFGTVLFGRMAGGEGADRVLGMFLNTLPLRLSLGKVSVEQALRQTHDSLAGLLKFEHASLAEVQQYSGVDTQSPLFTSLLNYRYDGGSQQLDASYRSGINGMNILFSQERSNYPVDLSVNDHGGKHFSLDIQVDPRIGAERVGQMLLTALNALTDALEQTPMQTMNTLPVLPEAERQQVLYGFNATHTAFPSGLCVHELFEQQVEQQPDATAVVFKEQSLSYGELNRRANQLAHRLIEQGVRPDNRVAIALERSPELIVALLATLKAGGAYVPLDITYPPERLGYMLADSEPAALITTSTLRAQLTCLSADTATPHAVIELEHESPLQTVYPTDNIPPAVLGLTPAHLAYVIYTSGSTGKPKGVMIEHRHVAHLAMSQAQYCALTRHDRVVQFANIGFDYSVADIFGSLCCGATLVLRTDDWIGSVEAFWQYCRAYRITYADIPTQFWKQLCHAGLALPETLRIVCTGGEAAPEAAVQSWFENYPEGPTLLNFYGPTEATVNTTALRFQPQDSAAISIGRPLANMAIYILDAAGQPVPVGVEGELYIGGVQVARGYLNKPELSAERFLDDPFSTEQNARMYRTGDLGRWYADGRIDYLGRNDDQVKIRGFRVELGEIETCLRADSGVTDTVVMIRRGAQGEQRLIAWYVGNATTETLRAQVTAHLPAYMVPSAYVQLSALPLTPNGKVDRKALPAPDDNAFARTDYEAPQTATEQAIATTWQDLLGIERIGRQDHFFELGGHSLLAIKLIERLRRAGYTLSVSDLFRQPTLAALATTLTATTTTDAVPTNRVPLHCEQITPEMLPLVALTQAQIDAVVATVPGGVRNVQDIYPLAPLQTGILFHHLLTPIGDAYISPLMLSFSDENRLTEFLSALQAVIQRHDILRTAIVWEGLDDAVQVVWRNAVMPVENLVITADDVIGALHQKFDPTRLSMNIAQAPMIQAWQAADPANNRWLLCLLHHHLCMDHTTLELLLEEVQAHLQGRADQLPAPLPFRQFVALARQQTDAQAQQDYFRTQLGDIDEPCAPFGLLDIQGSGQHIDEHHLPLSDRLGLRLRTLSQQRGISVASLFHLAWGRVVQATTGQDNVVFGTVLFGRMAGGEGADRVLGMFLNTLPLRLSLGQVSVEQALRQTHDGLAGLLRFEHASLADVQQYSGVGTQSPLFTSLLNYRYNGGSEQTDVQTELTGIDVLFSQERTNYPINVSVNDQGTAGFSLDIQVAAGIGAARVGEMMQITLTALADALAQEPTQPVHRLTVLPDAERQQVLQSFNDTNADFPADICIHELVEQQAARQPDAVAVVFDGQSLSYGELNRRANQLAHWLIEQGLRPDNRVAMALERSVDLVVALLATLKAGGAYVPLDPAYPPERLRFILADCAPVALITTTALNSQMAADCPVIELDTPAQPWSACPTDNIAPATRGLTVRHLAYVIYTSGSTGQPKGVLVEHGSVVNLWAGLEQAVYGSADLQRVSLNASPSFDASVQQLVQLASGRTLVIVPEAIRQNGEQLRDWLAQQALTVFDCTPSQLALLMAAGPLPPSLRTVLLGGEAINAAQWQALASLEGITFHNVYGPTECTVDSTHTLITGQTARPHIGRPMANRRIYLLDADRQPVPVGVAGEIYIGGAGVARGYLNRPDLSAEHFLTDPFSTAPNARLYRTGDLGRWNADGTIDYLGRNDDQVKIRGFRIEPGEIAAALTACTGITDAVVTISPAQQLLAYYTSDHSEVTTDELKAQLAQRLPGYMVPSAYVRLEQIPLTQNGKVDRKALPAPDDSAFVRNRHEAPQGETEQALAAIWQSLLGIERVGRQDHFFELGGHSLLAVRLVSHIRSELNRELPLAQLFAHPTLNALAAVLQDAVPQTLSAIELLPDEVTPPLSLAQQRLWFLTQLDPAASAAYVIQGAVQLQGALNSSALTQALDRIMARHAPLRTRFEPVQGDAVQVIEPAGLRPFPLAIIAVTPGDALPLFAPVFDLRTGPLVQGQLLRVDAQTHLLRLALHHIIADGWSVSLFIDELSTLYAAFNAGQPDPLPALRIRYGDYAAWQRQHLLGDVLQRQQQYWVSHLRGAPDCL